jgi:glycosyltransferase involved in cell wall biosynthesis
MQSALAPPRLVAIMRFMHIGLITSSFLPCVGGLEWKVHFLARAYRKKGHQVTVFTIRPRLAMKQPSFSDDSGYTLVRAGWPVPGGGRFGFTVRALTKAVLNYHNHSPLDILHCHHLGYPTRIGLKVKQEINLPVIATTCGADVQIFPELGYGVRLNPAIDRLVRENLIAVDRVGAVSPSMHAAIRQLAPTAKIIDIPNGLPWNDFQTGASDYLRQSLAIRPESLILLSVGRNHRIKGYDTALKAFAEAIDRGVDAVYVIVGRDSTELAPKRAAYKLENRVQLINGVSMGEMPTIFHSADLFFNPSLMEGFSQVNVQAMASRLPCIITDGPGNRDSGKDGGAIITQAGDVKSMTEAIVKLSADPALRERLGHEAFELSRRFDWDVIADEYLELFASVAVPPSGRYADRGNTAR